MWARVSAGVTVLYLVLIGAVTYLGVFRLTSAFIAEVLLTALLLYLGRYVTTRYRLSAQTFAALRLFGSRRIPIEQIRHVQRANLRELAPVSFFGTWGWRGRMWSSQVGSFDTVHTSPDGLLVTGGAGVPVFITPKDPGAFIVELSRRVRSYHPNVDIEAAPT